MTIRLLFPEEDAWVNGRRTVSCVILNPNADLTSSLLNPWLGRLTHAVGSVT